MQVAYIHPSKEHTAHVHFSKRIHFSKILSYHHILYLFIYTDVPVPCQESGRSCLYSYRGLCV